METNRYALCRREIHRISQEEAVDVGVACAMLRDRMGWHFDGPDRELTAFCAQVQAMDPAERLAYFEA